MLTNIKTKKKSDKTAEPRFRKLRNPYFLKIVG